MHRFVVLKTRPWALVGINIETKTSHIPSIITCSRIGAAKVCTALVPTHIPLSVLKMAMLLLPSPQLSENTPNPKRLCFCVSCSVVATRGERCAGAEKIAMEEFNTPLLNFWPYGKVTMSYPQLWHRSNDQSWFSKVSAQRTREKQLAALRARENTKHIYKDTGRR